MNPEGMTLRQTKPDKETQRQILCSVTMSYEAAMVTEYHDYQGLGEMSRKRCTFAVIE